MPSFADLMRHPKRESTQLDSEARNGIMSSLDNDNEEKGREGRKSKRDFFRHLLKRSSLNSSGKQKSSQFPGSNVQIPTSPLDSNKPLPPPPPPGTVETQPESKPEPAVVRPVQNLRRIMSPIAVGDLHKLFSGAPQFFARSEGHHTGAPHPSVAFPWDIELEIRDLCDHVQIHDEAWSSVTAWPHVTRDVQRSLEAVKEHHEKQRAHFLPRCRERPNMLSMQGIERGSMGYQAALEMGVADALQEQEASFLDDQESHADIRKKFLNGKNVRPLAESVLIDRLIDVSTTYHDDPQKHRRPTVELYTQLFLQVLFPPPRVTDSDDPYSLQVQIESLIKVLATPDIWVDFSLVEWRIRLGQILWEPPFESGAEDDITVNNEVVHEAGTQKYWLLLQILLSCELLLRLDIVASNLDHGLNEPTPDVIKRFEKLATPSVKWSHILARFWLENIRIVKTIPDTIPEKKPQPGWLATLTGSPPVEGVVPEDIIHNFQIEGRHQARQLNGLLHFARRLNWRDSESLAFKISSNGIKLSGSAHSTAAGTPMSVSTQRSTSYFSNNRPGIRRGLSKHQLGCAVINSSGWLSNSYISGLILPGEGISHFLISTLLENDETALSKLGREANLYGGFSFSGRSFWSTSCIVGRVLAAGKGTTECMGWISSEITPRGTGEVWVNIDVEQLSEKGFEEDKKPRIWHKAAIEHDGNVIGGADALSVLPGDFILPSEEPTQQQALSTKLESLDLFVTMDSVHTTPTKDKDTPTPLSDFSEATGIQTYSALMRFSIDAEGEAPKEINVELKHDVHFVTAFPCISSQHTEIVKSPTSTSFQSPPHSPTGSARDFTGHCLHKAFTFTRVSLSTFLSSPRMTPFDTLLSPPQSPPADGSSTHTTNSKIPKVLVIDCTDSTTLAFPIRPSPSPHLGHSKPKFGSDMEMLARALCAEQGWNALISRRGRGCLACSIREAGALGWRVVLRFA